MGCVDIISIIKDIFLGLSAIAIAVLAWLGLKTWRRELTGKAKFETARNMMHIGYKLKADLEFVRNPFTYSYESADRTKQSEESDNESQVLDEWHAKSKRLNPVTESLNKLIELQWESEILLDEHDVQSIKEAVQSFRESYAELSSAISSYFDTTYKQARARQPYKDQEWLKELHHTIYSVGEDDLSKKVDEATEKLSSALKQYVK